jgi:uncharacterized circularly permuted ATP-grasp superfamily protein/uncharacterized alpha-E superfamily protein
MVDGQGGVRPHWRALLGVLTGFGPEGLARLRQRLDRAFEDEGITSVLPGASVQDHPWRCDPVPLILPEREFLALEAGLAQRARLLEAVLEDLTGPRRLLAEGLLPPAFVFANPGFVRLGGMPAGQLLTTCAADLVRGADGAWRVLADRTTAGVGIGFARENRRILARVAPEGFRAVQVRELRPFFDLWQDALRRMAGPSGAVALLTPGTGDPRWFEHMYLARELASALVEGGDLTVRDGALYLKTLKGLQRVNVLLRRVDGRLLDPLELEADSAAGVPGLLDAVRAGNLRVVNDPRAGLLEAPAFIGVLPALARRLLGEELLLGSVPSLWLGEAGALARVLAAREGWWLRPAFVATAPAVDPDALAAEDRAALWARVAAAPEDWVALAPAPFSHAPGLTETGLQPRPVVLRQFLAFDGARWRAMAGGLARMLPETGRISGRIPRGAMTKDVWVLAEERADIIGPAALEAAPLALRRTSGDLPSRVADNLFWLGRHVERVERAARLVRAAVARLARGATMLPREQADLRTLGRCLVDAGVIGPEAAGGASQNALARALCAAVGEGGAITAQFDTIAALTERVRDRLTGDMHATFTQTLRAARADAAAVGTSLDGLAHGMVGVMRFSTAVAGVAAENMVRGGGFVFLDLGRRIERAQAVTSEIGFALETPPARIEAGLRLILELCDSVITYRSRYLDVLQPAPVLDLVLADQGNPRGLAFQLAAMHTLLDELSGESGGREMLAGAAAGLLAEAEALVAEVLAAADQAAAASALVEALGGIGAGLAALSDRITRRYFALLPAAQLLGLGGATGDVRGAA